jgi:hypothetical protein
VTGRDLISASLRLIGAIAPGQSLGASEATEGLDTLNQMIDSWSNDSLMVYSRIREEFNLIAGQQAYTIGVDGDFDTSRPQQIENATLLDESQTPSIETPIAIIRDQSEWANIPIKGIESSVPCALFMNDLYPQASIYFYPVPSEVKKVVLWSWKPLTAFTLDTVISLPPGYEKALKFNLAIDLAPEYGRSVADTVLNGATESKSAIERKNVKQSLLGVDSALLSRSVFNIYTGGIQ